MGIPFGNQMHITKDRYGQTNIYWMVLVTLRRQINMECFRIQLYSLPFRCINCHYGNIIRGKLGTVMKVDVDGDDTSWGEFLRVWVEIDLNKPLVREQTNEYNGKKLWISIRYEKLPRYCSYVEELFIQQSTFWLIRWIRNNMALGFGQILPRETV